MNKIITAVVIVAIVVLGGYFLLGKQSYQQKPQPSDQKSGTEPSPSPVTQTPAENIIRYTANGYTPLTLTIKAGETVTFKNESGESMWTASAMHPTHIFYSQTSLSQHCPDTTGTAFDQCGSGNEFRFTFTKVGTWKYHNHLNASHAGVVVVE